MGATGDFGTGAVGRALDRLRETLGPDRVLDQHRTAEEIQQRSLNPTSDPAPQILVRPQSTEECRFAIDVLGSAGCHPRPIASLTTFWEPASGGGEVAIDTLGIRTPAHVDVDARIGRFGAGATVREVDRQARANGLCLVAYPDSDGSATVGSVAAVACTAGLGLGRVQPVEQIVGLTIVTPDATIVRTGAAWRLGHGGIAHGMPDPTGIFLGSQGRFGVVAEVLLALAPAPFLAARRWQEAWQPLPSLVESLRQARAEIDRGVVDSVRLEAVAAGDAPPRVLEWFVRCWAPDAAQVADQHGASIAKRLGARNAQAWIESSAGQRGELPDHDARYSMPPGSHRERTGRDGFVGVEVNVNWGEQLDGALRVFEDLFATVAKVRPGHLRLGIYPGPLAVSIGVQAMVSGGATTPAAVRDAMAPFVERLSDLGAIPYRAGRLWSAVVERQEHEDPACALTRRLGLAPADS